MAAYQPPSSQASSEKLGLDKVGDDGCSASASSSGLDTMPPAQDSGRPAAGRDSANDDPEKGGDGPPPNNAEDETTAFLVAWDDGEKANPRNWSAAYKGFMTLQLGMLALAASLASSIIAPAEAAIAADTGVQQETAVLCVSLYVLGFAFGPLLWAPVSEVYGRKASMLPAMVGLALFSIGTAVSKNAASIFVTRFFGGIFGSAPVSNVSAALGDMYEPKQRGIAVTFYAVAVVGGPTIGPVIGAALTANPHLGWRWTQYIQAIWAASVTVMAYFLMPEVYGPFLLKRKAQRKRKETGDDRWWHPHEQARITISNIVTKHVSRPIVMLTTEPMVTCIAIYASFVFGLLYLTLEVFPIVYRQNRQYGLVVSTLPFLGLFVGVLCAVVINLANQPRYARIVAANKGRPVPRSAPSTNAHRRLALRNRNIRVRVDREPKVQLGYSHHLHWLHRRRVQCHFPAMHQLPGRHIHLIRRICGISEHVLAFIVRFWSATGGKTDVPQPGCGTCLQHPRRDCGIGIACPVALHEVWAEAEKDEQVRSSR